MVVTYNCLTHFKIPFVCNICGYRGNIKVQKDDKKEIEILIE